MALDKIYLTKISEVYFLVDADSESIFEELKEYFRFRPPNYKHMPLFKNGVWDGYINIFDSRNRLFYIGLLDYMYIFGKEKRYEIIVDTDVPVPPTDLEIEKFHEEEKFNLEPRYYQSEALEIAVKQTRALLLCPTGSGKSFIMYMIMRWYKKPTLIIVPTTTLVHQLYTDFEDYGFNSEKYVHKILSGADKKTDKPVVISTWQSIYKLPDKWFSNFDVVIGDECHLFQAKSLTTIMQKMPLCKYRFGLTGSLDGSVCNRLILEGLFGRLYKIVKTKKLMDEGVLAKLKVKVIKLEYTEAEKLANFKKEFHDEIRFLVDNQRRNEYIKKLATKVKGNTLVLFQFVDDHGQVLYDMIRQSVGAERKVFFIHGKIDSEERNSVREIVENETDAIIVASVGTFSTGINIKNLHNIIFASPSKSRIRNLQSIGRALRVTETKQEATIYDIADDMVYQKGKKIWFNYGYRHLQERLKIYTEEEFDCKQYGVVL